MLSPHPGGVALVLAAHTDRWLVAREDAAADADPVLVAARGRLRDDAVTGPPVTGDRVVLDEGGAIAQVLPRRGTIVRRAAGEPTAAQVLAANVDLALVVEPFPDPNARRAERFAALASAGGVEAALVLSKADLDPAAQETAARLARRVGVLEGIAVSAHDGDGVTAISALLTAGKTAVLLGPSGAGKSTLANALLGEERQATREVRASDHRGRHTTVTRDLLRLPSGAALIDTPGLRLVGTWDGAGAAFADVEVLAERCRFADCNHDGEPGCAVAEAVDPDRLRSWHRLRREQARLDDRRAADERDRRLTTHYRRTQRAAARWKGRPPG